jgi:hypothetical protein
LGAIVTILNLAFATFTQQLITSEVRSTRDMTAVATPFARSHRYRAINLEGTFEDGEPLFSVDFLTLSAIIGSGLQGNNAQPLQVKCPSGDCRYPTDIPSLAISGSCTDVTDHLDNKGSCKWEVPPCNKTTPDGDSSAGLCGAVGEPCKYRLPTGPSLTFQPGHNATISNDIFSIWNATNLAGTAGQSVGPYYPEISSIVHNDMSYAYIMKFADIGLPPGVAGPFINGTQDATSGTLPPMQAYECALWLCTYAPQSSRAHTDTHTHSPRLLRHLRQERDNHVQRDRKLFVSGQPTESNLG